MNVHEGCNGCRTPLLHEPHHDDGLCSSCIRAELNLAKKVIEAFRMMSLMKCNVHRCNSPDMIKARMNARLKLEQFDALISDWKSR